jgi:hypothetical protein
VALYGRPPAAARAPDAYEPEGLQVPTGSRFPEVNARGRRLYAPARGSIDRSILTVGSADARGMCAPVRATALQSASLWHLRHGTIDSAGHRVASRARARTIGVGHDCRTHSPPSSRAALGR